MGARWTMSIIAQTRSKVEGCMCTVWLLCVSACVSVRVSLCVLAFCILGPPSSCVPICFSEQFVLTCTGQEG